MKTAFVLGLSLYLATSLAPARADAVDRCQGEDGGIYFIALGTSGGTRTSAGTATIVAPYGLGRGQYSYVLGRPGTRNAGSVVGIEGSVTFADGRVVSFGEALDDDSGEGHTPGWIDARDAASGTWTTGLDCAPSSADLVCAIGGAGSHPAEIEIEWTRYNRGAADAVTLYDAAGGSTPDWVLDETNDARTHATLSQVVYGDPSPDTLTGTLDASPDGQVTGTLLYEPGSRQSPASLSLSCQGQLSGPKQNPICPRC